LEIPIPAGRILHTSGMEEFIPMKNAINSSLPANEKARSMHAKPSTVTLKGELFYILA
jgi:hypothetical protein